MSDGVDRASEQSPKIRPQDVRVSIGGRITEPMDVELPRDMRYKVTAIIERINGPNPRQIPLGADIVAEETGRTTESMLPQVGGSFDITFDGTDYFAKITKVEVL